MIIGRGVYLRPALPADYPQWFNLRSASMAYLRRSEPGWTREGDGPERYARDVESGQRAIREGIGYPLLIFRHDWRLVGGLQIGPIKDKSARLGIWIGKPFAGRGYAIRAVYAALAFAFDHLGLDRIDATALPDNSASIRVMKHLGFKRESGRVESIKVKGFARYHLVYSISKGELKGDRHERDDNRAAQLGGEIQGETGVGNSAGDKANEAIEAFA